MVTLEAIRAEMRRWVAPIERRVRGMVTRAVLEQLVDSGGLQVAQAGLLADETADEVEVFGWYGFTSVPRAGAEAIAVAVGGNRGHLAVIAVGDRRYRLKDLAGGEVALHSDVAGQVVHLKANGDVIVTPGAGGKVFLGGADAAQFVALAADVKAHLDALQVAHDTHVHPGVTPGMGSTAVTPTVVGALADIAATLVKAK